MGGVKRGGFEKHYDVITPYLADATSTFEDLEIFAVSPTFGYSTMIQRLHGKTTDGGPFDFRFRLTSLLRKIDGKWKYIHEHFSFPVNMATKQGDFTSGKEASDDTLDVKVTDKAWIAINYLDWDSLHTQLTTSISTVKLPSILSRIYPSSFAFHSFHPGGRILIQRQRRITNLIRQPYRPDLV